MRLSTVALSAIKPNPLNLRSEYNDIDGLAASIREVGMIQPITGHLKNGELVIVAGHRRYHALVKLVKDGHITWDEKVKVLTETQAEKAELSTAQMLVENMQREGLSPMDEADGVIRLASQYGMKLKDIAAQLGVTQQWVKDRMALASLDDSPVVELLDQGKVTIAHAVDFANLPEDKREKLTKDGKVPTRFDIETAASKQRNAQEAAVTIRKLKKQGVLVVTEEEAKRIAKTDYADLASDPDGMSVKTLLGEASTFASNRWNPEPGVWLDATVIARHHKDPIPLIDLWREEHGKNIVIVAAKVNGFVEWQQWKCITVAEDGTTDEELTDLEKMEELVDEKNAEAREKYNAKVAAARWSYVNDTKPAALLRDVVLVKLLNDTTWSIPDEMFEFIGVERSEDRAENAAAIEAFATQNATNLARAAALMATVRMGDLEKFPIVVPERPAYHDVDYDQYDSDGAYIHPSEEAEVA